jgi:phytoene synthase
MLNYIMYINTEYQADLKYCEQFIFSFGSNYSLGVKLFNKRVREATIFFYAFVRYADELVDNPEKKMAGQTHAGLNEFIIEWKEVVTSGKTLDAHPILRSTYFLFSKYNIPFKYTFDFLDAMDQDLNMSRYKNYTELENYMWGSASIVGHTMTYIVGYTDKVALEHAKALGEAMQLANFLRDVNEDYQERDRVYLPQNDMLNFGVNDDMIAGQKMTPELHSLVEHYTEITEDLFTKGISGIKYLKNGKFSILLASRMYRENIRILKKRNYNIFGKKIRLSKSKKIQMVLSTFLLYVLRGLK